MAPQSTQQAASSSGACRDSPREHRPHGPGLDRIRRRRNRIHTHIRQARGQGADHCVNRQQWERWCRRDILERFGGQRFIGQRFVGLGQPWVSGSPELGIDIDERHQLDFGPVVSHDDHVIEIVWTRIDHDDGRCSPTPGLHDDNHPSTTTSDQSRRLGRLSARRHRARDCPVVDAEHHRVGTSRYTILRSTNGASYASVASVASRTTSGYTDTSVAVNTSYWYEVQAVSVVPGTASAGPAHASTPMLCL